MTDVCFTAIGTGEVNKAAERAGAIVGYETGNGYPENVETVGFCDYPFTKDNLSPDDHLQAVKEAKPKIAVAPDVEKGHTLDRVLDYADALREYADTVVIVPKDCHPTMVPDRFRVGFPAASFGSGMPHTVWDFRHCASVHILGGPPDRQIDIAEYGVSVDSLDTASPLKAAKYGRVWTPRGWQEHPDMDYYERVESSYREMVRFWNDTNLQGDGNA